MANFYQYPEHIAYGSQNCLESEMKQGEEYYDEVDSDNERVDKSLADSEPIDEVGDKKAPEY